MEMHAVCHWLCQCKRIARPSEPQFVKHINRLRKAAGVLNPDGIQFLIKTSRWYRSPAEVFRNWVQHHSTLSSLIPSNFGYFWDELILLGRLLLVNFNSFVRTGTASGTRSHTSRQCHARRP
jgi:hypothetical protein